MRHICCLLFIGALPFFMAGHVFGVTCDECQQMEKSRVEIQQEITSKDKELTAAFEKKEFQKVRDIRTKVTELRRKLLDLRSKDEECKQACRPDVMKAAECDKIREEILKLESDDSKSDEKAEQNSEEQVSKIDGLYRDLQRCNKELTKLKKTAK